MFNLQSIESNGKSREFGSINFSSGRTQKVKNSLKNDLHVVL